MVLVFFALISFPKIEENNKSVFTDPSLRTSVFKYLRSFRNRWRNTPKELPQLHGGLFQAATGHGRRSWLREEQVVGPEIVPGHSQGELIIFLIDCCQKRRWWPKMEKPLTAIEEAFVS